MAQFSFTLIGTPQPVLMDVDADSLDSLSVMMSGTKYLHGDIVTPVGELVRVLLPVNRVQFVSEFLA